MQHPLESCMSDQRNEIFQTAAGELMSQCLRAPGALAGSDQARFG